MKVEHIYNLEFPPYVEELRIGDYCFKRVENYKGAFQGLMHLVNSSGSELSTRVQTGAHQITATVEIPAKEKKCVLPWADKKLTQLDDILFLLSIFTDRNVFKNDRLDDGSSAIIEDHRMHASGAQLRLSSEQEWVYRNRETGEVRQEADGMVGRFDSWDYLDIGFEKSVNRVLTRISSAEWQKEYEGGYFLFLFRSAIRRQMIETSFLSCWTIWEHVFAIKNRAWLDERTLQQMSGDNKISFVLREYFLREINRTARDNIHRITTARNRLVHYGKRTEHVELKEMVLFVHLTEQLMAIVLGLSPSNLFNSFERLDGFLAKTSSTTKRSQAKQRKTN